MKVFIFAPHALIWQHAFPEALLIESLKQEGHEISYLGCNSILSNYCIPMISSYISHDAEKKKKDEICKKCKLNASIIKKNFDFDGPLLDDYIDQNVFKKIEKYLQKVTKNDYMFFNLDGINLGSIALYELSLRHKLSKVKTLNEKIWPEYLASLESVLKTFFALKVAFKSNKPDRILAYNGLYSVNTVCRELAKIENIPFYYLHAGLNQRNRLQSLIVAKGHTFQFYRSIIKKWLKDYSDIPVTKEQLKLTTDNFLDIINGGSWLSYSKSSSNAAFDLKDFFNIPTDKKIITVLLSSLDEKIAAEAVGAYIPGEPPLFKSQIEWLKVLIKFMKTRDDLFMIIRPHPREYGAAREKVEVVSEHADQLKQLLEDLPNNIVVNLPEHNISIYDIMEETNLFLSAFSTAARELTMFGLPVLTYKNEDILEPVSIIYDGNSQSEFLEQIDKYLDLPFNVERIRRGFRWRVFELIHSHIDISESIFLKDDYLSIRDKIYKGIDKVSNLIIKGSSQTRDCKRRAKNLVEIKKINELIEKEASTTLSIIDKNILKGNAPDDDLPFIREEISRLVQNLYPNNDNIKKDTLRWHLTNFVNEN